jgi:single-stranded DNA-specific DHH superfamily exonuclease
MFFFQAELELLLMNDGTERDHFSLKSIQEQEKEGKKKKKKLKKKLNKELIEEESKKNDFKVIFLIVLIFSIAYFPSVF